MDWTIVVSVLVALLLWPVVMGSAAALVGLTAATLFRGRIRNLKDQKMAHCKEMFSSWAPATAAAGVAGSPPCGCAPTAGGGEPDA